MTRVRTMIATAIVLAGLAGCRSERAATEIVVTVDTSFPVPCAFDTLRFAIAGSGEPVLQDVPITDADLPGSITLVPDDPDDPVTVTVTGLRAGAPFAVGESTVEFDQSDSLELRFVLDPSCIPGPCPAVGIGEFVGLPAPVPRHRCGELGYERLDSVFVARDACEMSEAVMGTALVDVDEAEAPSPLVPAVPFPFNFYGQRVEQIWVGSNGYVTFGLDAPQALTADVGPARSLETAGGPAPGILPFWDDLRTGPHGVCFAVSGEAPNRLLWITWKEACFRVGTTACSSAAQGRLTFSVALEESTDRAFIGYKTMFATSPNQDRARASTATIGVAGDVQPGCLASECSADGACPGGAPCGYNELSSGTIVDPFPTLEFRPR